MATYTYIVCDFCGAQRDTKEFHSWERLQVNLKGPMGIPNAHFDGDVCPTCRTDFVTKLERLIESMRVKP